MQHGLKGFAPGGNIPGYYALDKGRVKTAGSRRESGTSQPWRIQAARLCVPPLPSMRKPPEARKLERRSSRGKLHETGQISLATRRTSTVRWLRTAWCQRFSARWLKQFHAALPKPRRSNLRHAIVLPGSWYKAGCDRFYNQVLDYHLAECTGSHEARCLS